MYPFGNIPDVHFSRFLLSHLEILPVSRQALLLVPQAGYQHQLDQERKMIQTRVDLAREKSDVAGNR